jgi:branched-chain amino acid transport system permease protein
VSRRPSRPALLRPAWELLGPALLVAAVAALGTLTSSAIEFQFRSVLVTAAIVVALYTFVGNSGVISFGHVSFVAVGAFTAGLTTAPAEVKPTTFPELYGFLQDVEVGNAASLALATAVGGVLALVVGIPIMRLSGLAAGIATFAVLAITNNVFRNWEKIGPGAKTLSLIPETTRLLQAAIGLLAVMAISFAYQKSRLGRMLRATREDPPAAQASGVNIHRQRLVAFTLSGALAGFSGGLLAHLLGSVNTTQVFLDLTFITLAMLVIGGAASLWGAVLGALLVSGLNSLLAEAEKGLSIGSLDVTAPSGTRLLTLGALMFLVLVLLPRGITGGRELSWPLRRPRFGAGAELGAVGELQGALRQLLGRRPARPDDGSREREA